MACSTMAGLEWSKVATQGGNGDLEGDGGRTCLGLGFLDMARLMEGAPEPAGVSASCTHKSKFPKITLNTLQ